MEQNKLKSRFQTEEVENGWAISYGDMITLLLGFFVIFFNIKSDVVNIRLLKKDLDQYFDRPQKEKKEGMHRLIDSTASNQTVPLITSDVANKLQIKSNIEGEKILIEFPGVSFFDSGSISLTEPGKQVLSHFAKALDGNLGLFRLIVRGYTDHHPLRSAASVKDNLELSAFRSISAIRFLAEQGIMLEKMRIAGYGESDKSRQDLDKSGSAEQRKIVIVIEPLDHTERLPDPNGGYYKTGDKAIEEVAANVNGMQKRGIQSTDPLGLGIDSLLVGELDLAEEVKKFRYWANDEIERLEWYQKFVDFLVWQSLRLQGYSKSEIKSLLQKNETKGEKL